MLLAACMRAEDVGIGRSGFVCSHQAFDFFALLLFLPFARALSLLTALYSYSRTHYRRGRNPPPPRHAPTTGLAFCRFRVVSFARFFSLLLSLFRCPSRAPTRTRPAAARRRRTPFQRRRAARPRGGRAEAQRAGRQLLPRRRFRHRQRNCPRPTAARTARGRRQHGRRRGRRCSRARGRRPARARGRVDVAGVVRPRYGGGGRRRQQRRR